NNDAFIYDAAKSAYICPAGEALIWHYSCVEKGLKLHRYWSSKCQGCALKSQCTPSTERRIRRWEHETVLEEMQLRLSKAPEMMRVRKRTVEHPFGTLKQWMGATHFLTRSWPGECGDEFKCARLQLETGHEHHRCPRFEDGTVSLKRLILAHPGGCKTALTCSRSRLMRSAALTTQSLSQRTSVIESDEVMSVFTHSGPVAVISQRLFLTDCCPQRRC
ncbi:hypothetical protein HDC30_005844, partial [Pseudomonas sp. JAI115]|nr:hypothetical protein [Pseudomonas sp. JAI115]